MVNGNENRIHKPIDSIQKQIRIEFYGLCVIKLYKTITTVHYTTCISPLRMYYSLKWSGIGPRNCGFERKWAIEMISTDNTVPFAYENVPLKLGKLLIEFYVKLKTLQFQSIAIVDNNKTQQKIKIKCMSKPQIAQR